jgi:hypothetical protein
VGPRAGEAVGRVAGEAVYHAFLSLQAYRAVLAEAGMTVVRFVAEDPACDYATILLARKAAGERPGP